MKYVQQQPAAESIKSESRPYDESVCPGYRSMVGQVLGFRLNDIRPLWRELKFMLEVGRDITSGCQIIWCRQNSRECWNYDECLDFGEFMQAGMCEYVQASYQFSKSQRNHYKYIFLRGNSQI